MPRFLFCVRETAWTMFFVTGYDLATIERARDDFRYPDPREPMRAPV